MRIPLRWRVAKVTGWLRGRFGRTSPEDVTDFAKVLALMVVGIDPTNGESNAKWRLSAWLQKSLREAGGQLHDLTQARPNENEELFLDLWLVSYAFRTKRNSALKPETRDAFVYRVEDFVLTASDLPSDRVTELLRLYRGRFAEYSTAYRKRLAERNFDFAEAVTHNLFGKKTDSIEAAVLIILTTGYALNSLVLFFMETGLHGKIARGMTALTQP